VPPMAPGGRSARPTSSPYRPLADGALLAHGRRANTTGLVFIPPLIGDTALCQLHRFRRLRRDDMALYTFAYPGHPGASGQFSLRAAIRATGLHLERAALLANRRDLPLFALGCCAAAIPLLAAVQSAQALPVRLLLLNPIVCFAPAASLHAFWAYSRRYSRNPLKQARSLPAFLDHLFPGIAKSRERFGTLERRRVALLHLLAEILRDRLLADVRIERPPVVCCYGESDALLGQILPRGAENYEAAIRSHCPRTIFAPLPAAHFLTGVRLRQRLRRIICAVFKT